MVVRNFVFKITPGVDAEIFFFSRIINGFKVLLTYVEGLIRNMGCKTAVVVELLLPKSSEGMWPFPLYFKGK